jgi:hypothetical protein
MYATDSIVGGSNGSPLQKFDDIMDGINAKHLSTSCRGSLDTFTLTLTSPKVPPKVITPTFALVDVDLFNDHDNIMTEIAVNLEHKEDENIELVQHFDDKENHPIEPSRLQTLV